jgi:predicted kinase
MSNNDTHATDTTATMIFTMGLPAAGKSTISRRDYASFTAIDPDAVKESHEDYDPANPAALHAWSQEITEKMFAQAIIDASGQWIVDGTGTNAEKMVRRMNAAKAAGFRVELLFVTVPLAVSLERNAKRERVVPTHIIKSKALDISTSFEIVAPYADNVRVVNNV